MPVLVWSLFLLDGAGAFASRQDARTREVPLPGRIIAIRTQ